MVQSDPDAGRTPRILIADDEKNMRNTLANILTREGYDVSKAASGEEAVELCAGEDFDVILMDVRMPGIDGVEAFRQIRRHREGVRIIMMSAYSVDELKQAALDDGAIAFLAKPLDVEQVIRLVSDVKDTTILVVVEEDERTVELLDGELSKHGYKVTLTRSPHDALELVEQIRFDLIFIDAELPSMSGLDLYLAIKQINPTAVAIMISGREAEFEAIAREAVRQTAYTFLQKPLEIDHVLGLLDRITGQRASGALRKPALGGS